MDGPRKNKLSYSSHNTLKRDFIRWWSKIGEPKTYRFDYVDNCTDPPLSINGGRTAAYEFYIIVNGLIFMLEIGRTGKSHDCLREKLINKYTKFIES